MKNNHINSRKKNLKQIETQLYKLKQKIEEENNTLQLENSSEIIDIANQETMIMLEMQKSIKTKKMLNDILIALKKIQNGTYGICEETGEPIGIERLKANPLARYSIETQKYLELISKKRN